jgi:hypothetical protein
MKATNIFHSLKSKGVCGTDGIPPKLPGVGSPLDKKLVGNQKNLPQELKDKIEAAPETSPANYGTSAPTKLNNDPPKKEITADDIITTEYDKKTGKGKRVRVLPSGRRVTSSFQVKPSSPGKKKSCGYKN